MCGARTGRLLFWAPHGRLAKRMRAGADAAGVDGRADVTWTERHACEVEGAFLRPREAAEETALLGAGQQGAVEDSAAPGFSVDTHGDGVDDVAREHAQTFSVIPCSRAPLSRAEIGLACGEGMLRGDFRGLGTRAVYDIPWPFGATAWLAKPWSARRNPCHRSGTTAYRQPREMDLASPTEDDHNNSWTAPDIRVSGCPVSGGSRAREG